MIIYIFFCVYCLFCFTVAVTVLQSFYEIGTERYVLSCEERNGDQSMYTKMYSWTFYGGFEIRYLAINVVK